MTTQEQLSQVVLGTIAIMAALLAYEFYKAKDGRLRLLVIELFISKIWLYGGALTYYWIMPPIDFAYIRICLLFPMFIVMIKLWRFIRIRK
jgi:hypothetical protein